LTLDNTITPSPTAHDWSLEVHRVLSEADISLVGYVPDAGHKRLIELCQADSSMRAVPLTTEEEGVGLALGAWLGGKGSALLLQSSGVGNMVNVLGTVRECCLPFLMIVTMRGEDGEFNPWQVPMGTATPKVLEAMGVRVRRAEEASEVAMVVRAALAEAYEGDAAVAVLISQTVIGIKSFQEQRDR
jgi:sulfopyruvate decarboxylase alpha subunit